MLRLLHFLADHARWCLIVGLATPLVFNELAVVMQSLIAEFAALLVFLAAFRIGHMAALGTVRDFKIGLTILMIYQVILPLSIISVATLSGWELTWTIITLVLVTSAPAVTASPNMLLIMGVKPDIALRMVCLCTAALPLTTFPVFAFMPFLGSSAEVAGASLRLLAVIALAGGLAFVLRHRFMPSPSPDTLKAVDGISAVALAVIVIGLMAAVVPTLEHDPMALLYWMIVAFGVNFLLQITAWLVLRKTLPAPEVAPYAIIAGNRNIALLLVALGENFSTEFLIFLGCYQFPMYLTPILLRRLYRRSAQD